ncbi:glycosyltransferase family 2 protein [Elusimicrobiota bacterium]
MDISIIIPVYNEGGNVKDLAKALWEVSGAIKKSLEIVFVDDGSTDNSVDNISETLKNTGLSARIIKFKKNFGQSAALACGIEESSGDTVVTLDGDGQNNPKDIPALLSKLDEGYDVVCGWRKDRHDSFIRVLPSWVANRFISGIMGISLHDHGCTLRAYSRKALEGLEILGEMHRLLPAYLALRGHSIAEISVSHNPRTWGRSKYGLFSRIVKVLLDAFLLKFYLSYFTRPMHLFGGAAFLFASLGLLMHCAVVIRRIFLGGIWLSPLFFFGFFFFAGAILFLFLGPLADIMMRNNVIITNQKPYQIESTITHNASSVKRET